MVKPSARNAASLLPAIRDYPRSKMGNGIGHDSWPEIRPNFAQARENRDTRNTSFVAPESSGRSKIHPVQIHRPLAKEISKPQKSDGRFSTAASEFFEFCPSRNPTRICI
jgi:hypothetical protein